MTLRADNASGVRARRGLNQCRNTKLVVFACQLAIAPSRADYTAKQQSHAKIGS
jgi:hypothetical protein